MAQRCCIWYGLRSYEQLIPPTTYKSDRNSNYVPNTSAYKRDSYFIIDASVTVTVLPIFSNWICMCECVCVFEYLCVSWLPKVLHCWFNFQEAEERKRLFEDRVFLTSKMIPSYFFLRHSKRWMAWICTNWAQFKLWKGLTHQNWLVKLEPSLRIAQTR